MFVQCYIGRACEQPPLVQVGMFAEQGRPMSLYVPGGSTGLVMFQGGRAKFSDGWLSNLRRSGASSCFSPALGRSKLETELALRSSLATRCSNA